MRQPDRYDHLSMLQDPRRWPIWPFLPMKRSNPKGGWPDLAVVTIDSDNTLKLYELKEHETLYTVNFQERIGVVLTPEEILAKGWVVD